MRTLLKVSHFLELLGLSIWTGGMLIIGVVVAPIAFSNLPIDAAGDLMARIFGLFNQKVTLGLVTVLIASFLIQLWGEPVPQESVKRRRWEGRLLFLFCLVALYTGVILTPKIEAARIKFQATGADPETFQGLHRRSEELASVGLIAAMALLYLKANPESRGKSAETGAHV